jgi:hypothetical protein
LTKVANPATLPASTGQVVAWNRANTRLAVGTSSNFKVYNWNGTTLTALADPATLPGGSIRGVAWNYDGTILYVQLAGTDSSTGPGIYIYSVNGDTLTLLNSFASRQVPPALTGTLGAKGFGTLAYYSDKNGV